MLNDLFFVCAYCPLASASQTVASIKFSPHFVFNCPIFVELNLKTYWFSSPKNCLPNFYFVKYEPYAKIINLNLISLTEIYFFIIYVLISKISSFDFCCDVTRLDNTFQRFPTQEPLLHTSDQLWRTIRFQTRTSRNLERKCPFFRKIQNFMTSEGFEKILKFNLKRP